MKKIIFLSFVFIFASRILFLSISPSFFDSLEYLRLFEKPSVLEALRQVHYPIHPAFISLGWLFNKIPFQNTLIKIELLNSLLGVLSAIIIFKIAGIYFEEKKALLLTLFASFTPYFWLSQVNVLSEPLLNSLLLTSLFFLLGSRILLSSFFFGLSLLVSSTAFTYLPIFSSLIIIQRNFKRKTLPFLISFVFFSIFSLTLYLPILKLRGIEWSDLLRVLSGDINLLHKIQTEGWLFLPRVLRNSLVVYFNYLTCPLGIILLILGVKQLFSVKGRLIILGFLLSFLWQSSYWQVGPFGRLSLLLTLLPLFLVMRIKQPVFLLGLFAFLVIYSARMIIPYHFQKVPLYLEKEYLESVVFADQPLLIVSNFEEPYLKEKYEYFVLNSPRTEKDKIKRELKKEVASGRSVIFTSQALTAPYFQYDGLSYHLLSKRQNYPPTFGEELLNQYNYQILKEWPEFDLKIYNLRSRL